MLKRNYADSQAFGWPFWLCCKFLFSSGMVLLATVQNCKPFFGLSFLLRMDSLAISKLGLWASAIWMFNECTSAGNFTKGKRLCISASWQEELARLQSKHQVLVGRALSGLFRSKSVSLYLRFSGCWDCNIMPGSSWQVQAWTRAARGGWSQFGVDNISSKATL